MQENSELVLIISTLLVLLITIALIILFTVFQKKKNALVEEQKKSHEKFEKIITETQIEIREETLRNISWELHDNIGQLLTLAKIQLQSANGDNFDEITETITKGLTEVRALSKLINPEAIKKIKLIEAVQLEVDRFNRMNFINSTLKVSGEELEINKKSSIIIFRILQEFFSNTIKHSKATNLDVEMVFEAHQLKVVAKDDGVGFTLNENSTKGIGLENIKNRAKLIGAIAIFASEESKGTRLKIIYKL